MLFCKLIEIQKVMSIFFLKMTIEWSFTEECHS